MSLRILAARGCLCTCPAGTQRQDDASEGHPEQEEQERRSELRIQEHPIDQAGRSCERRQYSEPDGQDARLQGYYGNGGHHHAQRQHGEHEEQHHVQQPAEGTEPGREQSLHFRSPFETLITMPERYETWLLGASCS